MLEFTLNVASGIDLLLFQLTSGEVFGHYGTGQMNIDTIKLHTTLFPLFANKESPCCAKIIFYYHAKLILKGFALGLVLEFLELINQCVI